MLKTIVLLGVNISRVSPKSASEQILEWVKNQYKTYVCVAPVSTLVDAQRTPFYMSIVNAAGMVTPDGMPVVWLAKLKGCGDIERTYGPDLMHEVCKQSQKEEVKHFFYGSTQETLLKLKEQLTSAYPGLKICGHYAPIFKPEATIEDPNVIALINDSQADILWVGLGSPKQDYWMHLNRSLLNVPVIIGAGAAFDFVSGVKPQAPVVIQRIGLEWFFRFCCEPRRLWRRYLIGNTLFIFYLLKDLFKKI